MLCYVLPSPRNRHRRRISRGIPMVRCSKRPIVWLLALATAVVGAWSQPVLADTVLITGANSGIGLEFVKQYAAKGWTVIATRRRSGDARVARRRDQGPQERARREARRHERRRCEGAHGQAQRRADRLLINNAGVYNDRSKCHDDDCPGDWTTQSFGDLHYDSARHHHGREREGSVDGVGGVCCRT